MTALEYLPAPEARLSLRAQYGLFIDGDVVEGTGARKTITDPSTGETLTTVAVATVKEIDSAVAAAQRCHEKVWSRLPGTDRAKYLFRLARIVEGARDLATLEAMESGTPLRETRGDHLPYLADCLFSSAGWADKLGYAGLGPTPRSVGVVGILLGRERPLLHLARHVAPALACGNTVVVQASTPLTALALAELCREADLPPGLVNVVVGDEETGETLARHPQVAVVTVGGSREAGAGVARAGRRLALDLVGEVTHLVFDDAPLHETVEGVLRGLSLHSGARIFVQEPLHHDLLTLLRHRLGRLRVGDPLDTATELGPLASAEGLAAAASLVERAAAEGALPWSPPREVPARGFWATPTLLPHLTSAQRITGERLTGPILAVLTFRTPNEAVASMVDLDGTTALWTSSAGRLPWLARRIRAGVVWGNTAHRLDPTHPMSGWVSGDGRHGLGVFLDG